MRVFLNFTLVAVALCVVSPHAEAAPRKIRYACSDGRDNDHDGRKDYPRDRGCTSKRDNNEYNRPRKRRTPTPTPTPAPTPAETSNIPTGVNVSLQGHRPFPDSNPWNQDISSAQVDPNSAALIASIGLNTGLHPDFGTYWEGRPIGFPYVVVSGSEPKLPMSFEYESESDPGPYPLSLSTPIEGGSASTGDRHTIVIDKDNWLLYETYDSHPHAGSWSCGSGAVFDLKSNALRPAGWTSADAAGLPIFPGLVRYDEVAELGEIRHALRFTVQRTRRAYVAPATHYASSSRDTNLPPMGMRVRLKASFNISNYSPRVQVILKALKKYGMFVADNGSNWYISGAFDERWDDDELGALKGIKGSNFEVVKMTGVVSGD